MFPYKIPDEKIKTKYKEIFALKKPLRDRPLKLVFDKAFSAAAIVLFSPLFALILIAYALDALFRPEDRGPILVSYTSSTRGKKFTKYKHRVAKISLKKRKLEKGECFPPYHTQSDPKNLTRTGRLLKKYYLDELPQVFNILRGEMSIVGPRALAWRDYEKTITQGNVSRKILKAGIFSPTHVRKGTPDHYNLDLEYGYIRNYMRFSQPALLWCDIKIIARGVKMIFEGKGY